MIPHPPLWLCSYTDNSDFGCPCPPSPALDGVPTTYSLVLHLDQSLINGFASSFSAQSDRAAQRPPVRGRTNRANSCYSCPFRRNRHSEVSYSVPLVLRHESCRHGIGPSIPVLLFLSAFGSYQAIRRIKVTVVFITIIYNKLRVLST